MASNKTPKNYRPEFKAKVALEATKGKLTVNEMSKQFSVHPTHIAKWKKQLSDNLSQVFDNQSKSQVESDEELINQLYSQIGQMKVELDWLKKKSALLS